jgi:zinc protease
LSPALRNVSFKDSKSLKSDVLLKAYKDALLHEATFIYTGSLPYNEISKQLNALFAWNESPLKLAYIELQRVTYNENTIFVNHNPKARQSNINFYIEGETLPEAKDKANVAAFNEYFGAGMSSLVFQEIREFRSLSYAAYARFREPLLNQNKGYLMGYMNTQSDKTIQGIQAMSGLFLDMPLKPERVEGIKKGLLQSVYTSRPGFRDMGSTVARWRRQGYDKDPSEMSYPIFEQLQFNNIEGFYKQQLTNKPLVVTVTGNLNTFDRSELAPFGKVIELKYEEFIKD